MSFTIGAPERLAEARADSTLRWAEIAGKKVFILRQKGKHEEICFDHGRMLAPQIEEGVFPEILDTIQTATDLSSDLMDTVTRAIYRSLSDDVYDACSDEFRAGVLALKEGVLGGLDDPGFSALDVKDAVVAIDVGNLAEGLAKRMEKPLAAEVSGTIGYIISALLSYRRGRSRISVSSEVMGAREKIGRKLRRFGSSRRRVGFGCTAVGAAPALCADGRALHARNFDGAFFAWNNYPGIMIIDETEARPDWHKYVAIGTAGLTYSGGISGMNSAGISAAIHQMSTARYDVGRPGRGYAIAPFLQQRILRECASLDEVEALLGGARHFASWTIVVSDAKAGACARFEISGGAQSVTRTDLGDRFIQTNHFLAPGTMEQHDFFEDLHFTPTFGKWLETRARYATVERVLADHVGRGTMGTDAAIGILGDPADGQIDGAPRSFGRTICKAYGIHGCITRADPDRAAPKDEVWFSIGNRKPGPHSDYAGFAIDWQGLDLAPAGYRAVRTPNTVSAEMQASMSDYVDAFAAVSRPKGPDGSYLGRDPTDEEAADHLKAALSKLDAACERVEDAGETDFAFRYARARLRHEAGEFDAAATDWDFLLSLAKSGAVKVHDWERTLVMILSAATAFARSRT
ncbi:MAG: C45 family autoproteolytic acyltransferase/hydrolase [Pseudomonadota bacterium]